MRQLNLFKEPETEYISFRNFYLRKNPKKEWVIIETMMWCSTNIIEVFIPF